MTTDVLQWVITQGIGAVLASVMFLIYRHDSKAWIQRQTETAEAYMAFGERYSKALAEVAAGLVRQAQVLERIERHLSSGDR